MCSTCGCKGAESFCSECGTKRAESFEAEHSCSQCGEEGPEGVCGCYLDNLHGSYMVSIRANNCPFCKTKGFKLGMPCDACDANFRKTKDFEGNMRWKEVFDAESFGAEVTSMPKIVEWNDNDGDITFTTHETFEDDGGKYTLTNDYEAIRKRSDELMEAESFNAEWYDKEFNIIGRRRPRKMTLKVSDLRKALENANDDADVFVGDVTPVWEEMHGEPIVSSPRGVWTNGEEVYIVGATDWIETEQISELTSNRVDRAKDAESFEAEYDERSPALKNLSTIALLALAIFAGKKLKE